MLNICMVAFNLIRILEDYVHESVVEFPQKASLTDIKIPTGFDIFRVNSTGRAFHIVGIKPNGTRQIISTTGSREVADALCREYNAGGRAGTGIQTVDMATAFGSPGLNAVEKGLGVSFAEKPESFRQLDADEPTWDRRYRTINDIDLARISRDYGKLNTYSFNDIWGHDISTPCAYLRGAVVPTEDTFIVINNRGQRYLVDRTGAQSYIRNWIRISS